MTVKHPLRRLAARSSLVLLVVLVGGLITYKAAGSLAVLHTAAETGAFRPRPLLDAGAGGGMVQILGRTRTYLAIVWPALVFGILIGGAVRTLVSPGWLADRLGAGWLRAQVAGAAAGAPLMLCSCCVAPIFTTMYERCRRLAPSLAVMLAAPSLNPAALALTFMFFAPGVAWTRLILALAAVLAGTVVVARLVGAPAVAPIPATAAAPADASLPRVFGRSCLQLTVRTVPLLLLGVIVSMAIADRIALPTARWPAAPGVPWPGVSSRAD